VTPVATLSLNNSVRSLAERLNHRYVAFHQSAKLPKKLALKASPPLLVAPHEKWRSAKSKLLIIGQETLRWKYTPSDVGSDRNPILNFLDFQHCENGVASMCDLYRWYSLGRAYPTMNSPFWRGFRALSHGISGCEDSALWTNVFKANVRGSVVNNCKAGEKSALLQMQQGLLRDEIALLKPDVVVFLSGPRYDSAIMCEFPDMEISPLSPTLPSSTAGVLSAQGLPIRTIRTYHPEYMQRSNQLGILTEIVRWTTGNGIERR
jgi:hypothetical protein